MDSDSENSWTRRCFVRRTTAAVSAVFASPVLQAKERSQSDENKSLGICPHPFLTPIDKYYTVARGDPKPHTLEGEALSAARMTADSWRLEITADTLVDPPSVKEPASLQTPRTIAEGNAIDLPMLMEIGAKHRVLFVKALQCLNIASPLGQGVWEGVPLREVLKLCGHLYNVRRVYFWGFHNHDPKQVFKSSVSYSQVMETPPEEFPVFLAYRLNGEPIPPVRGGPVRMIVPWSHGFKNIKWLQHIFLTNDYRTNDTYALANNDPESPLKTAAYLDELPKSFPAGQPVLVTGNVVCGQSGLDHVEYWLRKVEPEAKELEDDAPELIHATWKPCVLYPMPDWESILPPSIAPHDILGFDRETGLPKSWPLRYGMASWGVVLAGLETGNYEIRVRSVDRIGFAQPEPRTLQKSGKNAIPVKKFEVLSA